VNAQWYAFNPHKMARRLFMMVQSQGFSDLTTARRQGLSFSWDDDLGFSWVTAAADGIRDLLTAIVRDLRPFTQLWV
jgi:hypothetical protein